MSSMYIAKCRAEIACQSQAPPNTHSLAIPSLNMAFFDALTEMAMRERVCGPKYIEKKHRRHPKACAADARRKREGMRARSNWYVKL